VLDAQTIVISSVRCPYTCVPCCFLGSGKGVKRHLNPLVADGVKANLKACQQALFGHGAELDGVVAWQAGS
jgi:hypothetical protein